MKFLSSSAKIICKLTVIFVMKSNIHHFYDFSKSVLLKMIDFIVILLYSH